jgi:hypothetical protein
MEPLKMDTLKDQALNFYVTGKIVEVASCSSCTYTYKDSLTPTVTALSTNSLKGGEEMIITGT